MTVKKARKAKPEFSPSHAVTLAEDAATFPVVGIGASAGGLAAFEAFFSGMPANTDSGMAFVLVQHLAPEHKSMLTAIIRRYTCMQVFEVEDGMTVQPNCVYIIPPNRDMALLNGTLQLLEPASPHGHRLPIDFFFRSLAQDRREQSIAIVLTGTGRDGTQGVRAIAAEGGMIMAQSPESAEFDGMPSSAIATGLVNYVLKPADMPMQLMVSNSPGHALRAKVGATPGPENALKKIFILLRAQTSHDFSQYKLSTVHRRIERRMVMRQFESIDDYLKYLQQTPSEVEELFHALLIGVTNFFRDPSAFEALAAQIIPRLFNDQPAGSAVRVWSTGCSTGEEAYSIAILLHEHMETLKQGYTVQVFATDIDSRAIAIARAGVYPASIAADLSAARLARFFTAGPDGSTYRIHKSIRDMLIFSVHDVIKDPPFSRLDLVTCRNLMIYMNASLQKKLISLFHYALNPGGMLFLGSSESVGEFADMFAVLDRSLKLYQRKEDVRGARRIALARILPGMTAIRASTPQSAALTVMPAKMPLRELTEQALLQQIAPAGALVNARGDILYLHGRAGIYLELPPGETGVNNILKMTRDGLQRDLTVALHKAIVTKEIVRCPNLRVQTNGQLNTLNLTIRPIITTAAAQTPEVPLFLVILEEMPALEHEPTMQGALQSIARSDGADASLHIAALKQELLSKEEYLLVAREEMESSNEMLKSSNEEMLSVNEELQSTNEELETSKEELQSINEELTTVNAELQTKVVDLSQANNDMNNLLAGTGIGTVFVDHQLRIVRFTPEARAIMNLNPSHEGMPVAHIVSNLAGYDRLVADVKAVLDTLIPREVDVQTTAGKWYTMRILPYRTLDNVIEGAVITFVDITEMVATREALARANETLRLAVVVRDAFDAITVQDLNGRILAWNPGAVRMYGWSEAEALLMNVRERIPEGLRKRALSKVHQLSLAEILKPYRTQRLTRSGASVEVWLTATALVNEAGQMYAIATTERAKEMPRTMEVPRDKQK
ncbi:MAG: chemotaxis protein CheB [Gallionella sp.]|nr:chemotaxis protein CheB [Gallionella sp.]